MSNFTYPMAGKAEEGFLFLEPGDGTRYKMKFTPILNNGYITFIVVKHDTSLNIYDVSGKYEIRDFTRIITISGDIPNNYKEYYNWSKKVVDHIKGDYPNKTAPWLFGLIAAAYCSFMLKGGA